MYEEVKKIIGIAVAAVLAMVALSGCAYANDRDLEGIDWKNPDKIEVYLNIDDHPNIVRMCIGGVGFATTSRINGEDALTRVEAWDAWCKE